jgi:hypothetical protein
MTSAKVKNPGGKAIEVCRLKKSLPEVKPGGFFWFSREFPASGVSYDLLLGMKISNQDR